MMKIKQPTPYNECMIVKVRTFREFRHALDEAENRTRTLAANVDVIGGTVETEVDFRVRTPFEHNNGVVVFRWSMMGRRSPEEIKDKVIKRRLMNACTRRDQEGDGVPD